MVVNIEIDDAVFEFLGKRARPFVDSPNDVLRRLLGLDDESPLVRSGSAANREPETSDSPQNAGRERRGFMPLPKFAVNASGKRVQRIPAGEMLPLEEYAPYILQALSAAGGEVRSRQMPQALLPLVGDRLTPVDKEVDETGVPRWHKRVGWAGSMCRKAGHIDPEAPRGVWRITQEGRTLVALTTRGARKETSQ
jgi:hypothetical protein